MPDAVPRAPPPTTGPVGQGDATLRPLLVLPAQGVAWQVARVTPDELRDLLARAGISSPSAFASLVGLDARSGKRWGTGSRPVLPGPAAALRVLAAVVGRVPYDELAALLRAEADRLEVLAKGREAAASTEGDGGA